MADGTTQGGTAVVAGDEITTDNGVTVTARQAQRVKIDSVGADGAFRDTSTTYPFPVAVIGQTALFEGRASTFRTVGKATAAIRRYLSIFNATGSGRNVRLNVMNIDFMQTAAIAIGVIAPPIRVYRITAVPTGGTALTKVAKDTALSSHANVTLLGDASADGTNSATTITATTSSGAHLTQEYFPRLITGAGYEVADRIDLLNDRDVILRPGEGLVLGSDITLATQEPATVMSICTIDWTEFAS